MPGALNILSSTRAVVGACLLLSHPALAEIIPGRTNCPTDTSCEIVLRNSESKAFLCTMTMKASATNATGRVAYVWSDQVRDLLIESDQETRAVFDFTHDMDAIWRADGSYGNLSPTAELKADCKAYGAPLPPPVPTPGPTTIDFPTPGLYEVATQNLSCNKTPAPCFEDSCRVTVFADSRIINASESKMDPATGKFWLRDMNSSCWIRGSSSYIKPLRQLPEPDFVTLGTRSYVVSVDFLSCNKMPLPCADDGCRVRVYQKGAGVKVDALFNQDGAGDDARPWFHVAERDCYVRASAKYLTQ